MNVFMGKENKDVKKRQEENASREKEKRRNEKEKERKRKRGKGRGREEEGERERERERENDDSKIRRSDQNVNVLLGGRPGPHCAADGRRRDASPPEHASSVLHRGRG